MRRFHAWAVMCALSVSLAVAPTSSAATATSEQDRTVTLITDDRVVERRISGGRTTYVAQAGSGRGQVQFLQYEVPGHHYVIPSDAAEPVAAGKLDEQLFDVARLLADGDDDRRSPEQRLVLQHNDDTASLGLAASARRLTSLTSLPGSAVRVPKSDAASTWPKLTAPGVTKVWLDRKVEVSLQDSMPQIGMPAA